MRSWYLQKQDSEQCVGMPGPSSVLYLPVPQLYAMLVPLGPFEYQLHICDQTCDNGMNLGGQNSISHSLQTNSISHHKFSRFICSRLIRENNGHCSGAFVHYFLVQGNGRTEFHLNLKEHQITFKKIRAKYLDVPQFLWWIYFDVFIENKIIFDQNIFHECELVVHDGFKGPKTKKTS